MTQETDPQLFCGPEEAAAQARDRLKEIGALFADMRALMELWLADPGPADKTTANKMLTKMGELQTAHLMMLRTEEAFYDKFSDHTAATAIDYDAIRDDIGRRLDHIRSTRDAE
ncbi:MAG: hypothetical protein AAFQ64_11535 [Pseudomonadota bacterium]